MKLRKHENRLKASDTSKNDPKDGIKSKAKLAAIGNIRTEFENIKFLEDQNF